MPLYQVAPTRQLPHTIDLIQRQSAPRFANEVERDQQYPDPELGALSVVNTTVEVFNGTGWIPVGGGQPTRINNLQDVDARFPPDGAVLTWSSAAQAWGWSMPATVEPTCVTWADDFERTDGPVGSNWTVGPVTGTNEVPQLLTIDGGAAIGPVYTIPTSDAVGSMFWADEIVADDQFIEVAFENWFLDATSTQMQIEIFNFSGVDSIVDEWFVPSRRAASFEMRKPLGVLRVRIESGTYTDAGDTPPEETSDYTPYTGTTGPRTLRLESYADGRQVVSLDGVVVQDYVSTAPMPATLGYQQGVYMTWGPAGGRTSPRILSITGGCLE